MSITRTASVDRIAYLTGHYPKASHTFIQREIAAIEALGAEVLPASIRRPEQAELIGPEEQRETDRTFYVLEAAKSPIRLLAAHFGLIARRPGRWLTTFGLALRTGRPGLRGWVRQIFYFLEAGVLAAELRRRGAQHLHNHFADSSANVAMLAAALADLPYSFTLHGPAELFEPESWHLGEKIARSAFTACISHFARSQAMLFSDSGHWDKLKIVHCGVAPDRYAADPLDQSAKPGELSLLFVGRLTGIKGIRVLFDALEQVRKSHPNVSLTLIGDGDERAYVDAQARRLGQVDVLGFQSQTEVAAALSRADALVLPSFAEGVPVVLMEAMASARPVIATRVGGVAELVEDKVSGHVLAPGDTFALTQAIIALADAPKTRAEMGLAGREKVVSDYDINGEAFRILTHFRGDLGVGPRPDMKAGNR